MKGLEQAKFFARPVDYVLFFALAALTSYAHLALHAYAFDDAYIHLRIAERFLETGRPYYNPDQAVMGSSSPAWLLVLTALFGLGGSKPWLVPLLNAALSVSGAAVYSVLLQRLIGGLPKALYWLFALLYLSLVQFSSIGLMETPLALLLFGGGLLLLARKQPAAFLLLSVAVFVRFELALFCAACLLHALWSQRMRVSRILPWSLAGALPFLAFWVAYFPLLPQTILAKSRVYSQSWQENAVYLFQNGFVVLPLDSNIAGWALLAGFLIVLVGGAWRARRSGLRSADTGTVPSLLLAGLLLALVYIAAGGLIFPWYLPLVTVPVFFALYALAARSRLLLVFVLVLALPPGIALARTVIAAFHQPARYLYFSENARVRKYLEVGARLYESYPAATLLSSEIGGLGYAFRGRVVDGAGLVSPEALKYHPMPVHEARSSGSMGAIPVGLIRDLRPELIVSFDFNMESFLGSELLDEYLRVREPVYVEEDLGRTDRWNLWGSSWFLNVLIRKDLVASHRPGNAPPG